MVLQKLSYMGAQDDYGHKKMFMLMFHSDIIITAKKSEITPNA